MGSIASQITSLTIVYSTVYSGTDQRKHQGPASLAFAREIHRWPVNSSHKWPSKAENVSIWWRHHGHSQKYPENSLKFCCFLKFPEELGRFPEISLIFHGKAISLGLQSAWKFWDVNCFLIPMCTQVGVCARGVTHLTTKQFGSNPFALDLDLNISNQLRPVTDSVNLSIN